MQKIKRSLLKKVLQDTQLTSLEINMILYVVKYADATGRCQGVYYKSMIDEVGCSAASFYNVRDSLKEKGYLQFEKNDKQDVDIILPLNNFLNANNEIEYKDYIDTNCEMLNNGKFYRLRAGAKRLALYSLSRALSSGEGKNHSWYKPNTVYETISKYLGITVRMLKLYFKDIESWVKLGFQKKESYRGKKYAILTVLQGGLRKPKWIMTDRIGKRRKTEPTPVRPEEYENKHIIKVFCRRRKIDLQSREIDVNTISRFFVQYRDLAEAAGMKIMDVVKKAILYTYKASGNVNSKGVHKAIRNIIDSVKIIDNRGIIGEYAHLQAFNRSLREMGIDINKL